MDLRKLNEHGAVAFFSSTVTVACEYCGYHFLRAFRLNCSNAFLKMPLEYLFYKEEIVPNYELYLYLYKDV